MSENDKGKAARAAFLQGNADRMADNAAAAREEAQKNRPPVVCLGAEGNQYVLYSTEYKRIFRLTAEKLTLPNLRAIAPRARWEAWLFPERVAAGDEVKRGELVEAMQERILSDCGGKLFDSSRVRSRGVWPDAAGGWVYNAGASCWWIPADGGKIEQIDNVRGDYVYSAGVALPFPADTPLSDAEGRELVELMRARSWMMPGSGELAAGWKVAAMLAGVMQICPHLWINAPAGTGKTRLKNDISALLGKFSMTQEGVPTEAAIRQRLNGDAVPVLLDEVEQGDNETSEKKIRNLLDLMRSASYGKDPMAKGGADGTPRLFPIKCSFALFSVANSIERAADSSRCLVLNLKKYREDEQGKAEKVALWERQDAGRELVQSPAFHGRLIARLLRGLPVLMENIRALADYLRALDGVDARRAELFSVLMACRHSLTSFAPLTPEQMQHAADILRAYGEQEEHESDSCRCLGVLLGYSLEVYGAGKMSVAEACRMLDGCGDADRRDAIARALNLAGLRWQNEQAALQVDPRPGSMKRIYAGTQWSNGKVAAVLAEGADRRRKGVVGANAAGIYYKSIRLTQGGNPTDCIIIPSALIF